MRIIGIDPGSGGGIAVHDTGAPAKVYKMPKGVTALNNLIGELKTETTIVFLENVSHWVSDSNEGGKQFGIAKMMKGFAELQAVLQLNNMLVIMVPAATWQSHLGLRRRKAIGQPKETKTERKARYKVMAAKNYPHLKVTLWGADALLILSFAKEKLKYDLYWIIQAAIKGKTYEHFKLFQARIKAK